MVGKCARARPVAVLRGLVIALAILGGFSRPARAEIVVAVAVPTSGEDSYLGTEFVQGTQVAIDRINRAGGLNGEPLRALVVDDACDADQAEAAARRVVTARPALVVGHSCSSASIRAAPIYAAAGIIQITPASTNPKLTEMGLTTVFRLIGRDDRQGEVAAARIQRDWPKAAIAVLDDGNTYGRGLGDAVRAGLLRRGLTPSVSASYAAGAASYRDQVALLASHRIGVVYIAGYGPDLGLLAREIRAAHLATVILSGDDAHSTPVAEIGGAASDGVRFTYAPDLTRLPAAARLIEALRQEGIALSPAQLRAYAAVEVWARAAAQVGIRDAAAVAAFLRAGPIETAIGPVAFDAKGDLTTGAGDWAWYRWHDGAVVPDGGG